MDIMAQSDRVEALFLGILFDVDFAVEKFKGLVTTAVFRLCRISSKKEFNRADVCDLINNALSMCKTNIEKIIG